MFCSVMAAVNERTRNRANVRTQAYPLGGRQLNSCSEAVSAVFNGPGVARVAIAFQAIPVIECACERIAAFTSFHDEFSPC